MLLQITRWRHYSPVSQELVHPFHNLRFSLWQTMTLLDWPISVVASRGQNVWYNNCLHKKKCDFNHSSASVMDIWGSFKDVGGACAYGTRVTISWPEGSLVIFPLSYCWVFFFALTDRWVAHKLPLMFYTSEHTFLLENKPAHEKHYSSICIKILPLKLVLYSVKWR